MTTNDHVLRAWHAVLEALLPNELGAVEAAELRAIARSLEQEAERRERADHPVSNVPAVEGSLVEERQDEPLAPGVMRRLRLGGQEIEVTVAAVSEGDDGRQTALPQRIELDARALGSVSLHERGTPSYVPRKHDWTADLQQALARLELKIRACDLALRDQPGSGSQPARDECERLVAAAAGLPRCRLWPLELDRETTEDWQLDQCARCYENLALAVRIALLDERWPTCEELPPDQFMFTIAEVQSALRAALLELGIHDDDDQNTVFHWLRTQAQVNGLLIPRYMRVDDPADPGNWSETASFLKGWHGQVARRVEEAHAERDAKRLLGKLRYEVGKLDHVQGQAERIERWTTILRTLDEWVQSGRPPSNRSVCELLVERIDDMPDELEPSEGAALVLRAVDDRIAQLEVDANERLEPVRELGPHTLAARELLSGRTVVLIGGERRPREEERLRRDLGLRELRWISTRPHRSIDPLIEEITKPEVDVVVVLVRFSDHAFGALKHPAEAASKAFVMARGGYGSERIAHEILEQVSERLAALGSDSPR